MTLENAKKFAQQDSNESNIKINVILDHLSEENDKYAYCPVNSMDIFYPECRKDFWEIVETISPKTLTKSKI